MPRTWFLVFLASTACSASDSTKGKMDRQATDSTPTPWTSDTGASVPTVTPSSSSSSDTATPPTTEPTDEEDYCVFDACGGTLEGLWLGTYECGRGIVDFDYGTSATSTAGRYGDYSDVEKVCPGVALDKSVDIEVWYQFEEGTLYTSFTYDVDTVAHYPIGCGDPECSDIVTWYTQFYELICEQPQNDPCTFSTVCKPGPEGCSCSFELTYAWNSGVQPYTTDGAFVDVEGLLYTYCVDDETTRFGDPETGEGVYVIERP